MSSKDYYSTLKVPKNATHEQIRQAFRRLAREYHPDLNKSPLAESRFKNINEAYEILGNPAKRAEYDVERLTMRHEGVMHTRSSATHAWSHQEHGNDSETGRRPQDRPDNGHTRASNPAANPFAFGQQTRTANPSPGKIFPEEKSARSSNPFLFKQARKPPAEPAMEEDPLEIRLALSLEEAAEGGVHDVTINLPELGGIRTFQVRVPAASMAGQKIRINTGPGAGSRGSRHLDLVVELMPHPRFRLEGRDLHMILPVSPWEAALGGRLEVATLSGRVIAHIPSLSSSGRKVRLRGQGFPARLGETPGDLLLELRVVLPGRLTEEESRLFHKLAAVSAFNPRS